MEGPYGASNLFKSYFSFLKHVQNLSPFLQQPNPVCSCCTGLRLSPSPLPCQLPPLPLPGAVLSSRVSGQNHCASCKIALAVLALTSPVTAESPQCTSSTFMSGFASLSLLHAWSCLQIWPTCCALCLPPFTWRHQMRGNEDG